MKSISLLLCITLFIFSPSILLAKQICIAPSGCSIEIDTGFCPKCIEVEELPIIKEEKVIMEKKPIVKIPLLHSDLLYSDLHNSDLPHTNLHLSDLHHSNFPISDLL